MKSALIGGDVKREVTLRLKVYPAVIPPEVNFIPELNAYDPPAPPGTKSYLDAHRLAHYHRATLNVLPYKQTRPRGCLPTGRRLCPTGTPVDWSVFDRCHGPLLDGSAFAGNPPAGRFPCRHSTCR